MLISSGGGSVLCVDHVDISLSHSILHHHPLLSLLPIDSLLTPIATLSLHMSTLSPYEYLTYVLLAVTSVIAIVQLVVWSGIMVVSEVIDAHLGRRGHRPMVS